LIDLRLQDMTGRWRVNYLSISDAAIREGIYSMEWLLHFSFQGQVFYENISFFAILRAAYPCRWIRISPNNSPAERQMAMGALAAPRCKRSAAAFLAC